MSQNSSGIDNIDRHLLVDIVRLPVAIPVRWLLCQRSPLLINKVCVLTGVAINFAWMQTTDRNRTLYSKTVREESNHHLISVWIFRPIGTCLIVHVHLKLVNESLLHIRLRVVTYKTSVTLNALNSTTLYGVSDN